MEKLLREWLATLAEYTSELEALETGNRHTVVGGIDTTKETIARLRANRHSLETLIVEYLSKMVDSAVIKSKSNQGSGIKPRDHWAVAAIVAGVVVLSIELLACMYQQRELASADAASKPQSRAYQAALLTYDYGP